MKKNKKIERNIINDVRNPFRLKEEINGTTIKYMRNLFRLKKENEEIKYLIIGDFRKLFEHKEEDY